MTNLLKKAALTGLAGIALLSAPAMAQSDVFEFSVQPTSLTSQAAIAQAYDRLNAEALAYCEGFGLTTQGQLKACQSQVVEAVVGSNELEALEAHHRRVLAQPA